MLPPVNLEMFKSKELFFEENIEFYVIYKFGENFDLPWNCYLYNYWLNYMFYGGKFGQVFVFLVWWFILFRVVLGWIFWVGIFYGIKVVVICFNYSWFYSSSSSIKIHLNCSHFFIILFLWEASICKRFIYKKFSNKFVRIETLLLTVVFDIFLYLNPLKIIKNFKILKWFSRENILILKFKIF